LERQTRRLEGDWRKIALLQLIWCSFLLDCRP
jgi:hypothetical protein